MWGQPGWAPSGFGDVATLHTIRGRFPALARLLKSDIDFCADANWCGPASMLLDLRREAREIAKLCEEVDGDGVRGSD